MYGLSDIVIEDLELLYKVDLVDYHKYSESPVAAHIDRVGKVFYKKQVVFSFTLSHSQRQASCRPTNRGRIQTLPRQKSGGRQGLPYGSSK